MQFISMGLHRNALWLSSIAVSLILLTGINRSQGAVSSNPSLPERYANLADRAIPGYKINPKPCRVKGREGTCMFVWECIKTEGQALGMCVEGFMFGSCCAHDVDNNVVPNSNPNQPDDHLPVSTTLFGLPTRPVTSAPQTSQYEKEEAENSEQEVTMAPSLITSKPLVVDMAPVTVEPVEATIASVWQKPTSASTTTTPASTTTARPTPSSAPPTSSAPLSSSNAGTEQEELLSMTTSLPETTTPYAQLSETHTSTPLAALPVPTNASHTLLTNGTIDVTTDPTLHFSPTDGPTKLSSTLPKNESLEAINVSPKPATEAGNISMNFNVTLSPFWTGTTDTVTRPPTTVATQKIKPNQHIHTNSKPSLTLNKKPTPRPFPTSTTFKTKVTLGGQRRSTTVKPLRKTTPLPAITPATIQRFTPTKSRTTVRPKTTLSVDVKRTTPATVAPQHKDPVAVSVVNPSFSPEENRIMTTVTSTTKTTLQEPPPFFTSTLSSVLGSTMSPAQVSFPEVTSPVDSPTKPNISALVTDEPTSLANSPTYSESTITSAFTTESSSPATTVSSLAPTTSSSATTISTPITTASSPVTTLSSPSTHSVLHSTSEKPSTAQPPVLPPTVTPVPLPEESTSTSTVTTTLIPTVSMITDNAWTPITQASKNPINVVSSTLGSSTVAVTTSTTQSSTATPTTTQSSRFPPTSAVTSIPSNDIHVECGVPQPIPMPELRIVGGRDAAFAAWPWQVSVRRTSFFGFSSTHRCGGALLNEQWIVTAGHCVEDLLTNQIRLRLGEYDFSSSTEPYPYIEKGASKKIVHPKYNFFTYEYDLALVRLEEPINFMPHIKPICLPAIDELMVGENATVTGWGRLSEGGTLPSKLQQVTVPIVSNEKCKNMFLKAGRHEYIPEIFMCAGYEEGGRDSCQGDSGGPLQARGKDGRYFLAGIISWGIGCAEKNLPGVCTRISKFTSWILENAT